MINSVIASSHFFYLTFFNSEQLNGIESVFNFFPDYYDIEVVTDANNMKLYHLQVEIERILGSESLLLLNKSSRVSGQNKYWYDFYLGQINGNNTPTYFICYPYIKLSTYADNILMTGQTRRRYIKPEVDGVLNYLKTNSSVDYHQSGAQVFSVEISKYSAAVKDDSANKINISGKNPLKSHVYNLLNNDASVSIEPLSLKLECTYGTDQLDLSFDKFGNMRFWLKRNCTEQLVNMISNIYQYFERLDVLTSFNFISKKTALENEQ